MATLEALKSDRPALEALQLQPFEFRLESDYTQDEQDDDDHVEDDYQLEKDNSDELVTDMRFPSEEGEPLHKQFDDEKEVRSYDTKRMSALSADLEDIRVETLKARSPRASQDLCNSPRRTSKVRRESGSTLDVDVIAQRSQRVQEYMEGDKLRSSRNDLIGNGSSSSPVTPDSAKNQGKKAFGSVPTSPRRVSLIDRLLHTNNGSLSPRGTSSPRKAMAMTHKSHSRAKPASVVQIDGYEY